MANPVGEEERGRIVAMLREYSGNQSRVAKLSGRSQPTVRTIAQEEGIVSINKAPKKANEARSAHAEIDRMQIIGDILTTGQTLLKNAREAKDYKDVVTGLAIGIDKHRLETGEVTDRKETRRGNDLKDFFSELDQEAEEEWRKGSSAEV